MREDRFTDKVVLITGGGTGIGKACAEDFAKEGAIVVIAGRREQPLKDTVKGITDEGGRAAYFTCDTSKSNLVDGLIKNIVDKYGRLDIAVPNASMVMVAPIEDVTDEDIDRLVDINIKGTYYVLRAVVRQMKAQGGGNIVTMSSMSGMLGHANMSLYCSTKAAIMNMSKALALELATQNIRVNVVCPGTIDTAMPRDFSKTQANPEAVIDNFVEAEPMKRLGDVGEVSTVVLFLASDEASFVTGSNYTVDAGFTAGK